VDAVAAVAAGTTTSTAQIVSREAKQRIWEVTPRPSKAFGFLNDGVSIVERVR
jgi:hypothetical protein